MKKYNMQELKRTIKPNSVLMLFKNAKHSIEQASIFEGLDIYHFMPECSKNNIAVISYKKSELENELKMLKTL